jgi:hypothetical protein
MFKAQPYDPEIGRRWLITCAVLGALMCVVTILVAADVVTGYLLFPFFVWFVVTVLGALLYGLGPLLTALAPPPAEPDVHDDPRRYAWQRNLDAKVVDSDDDLTHNEICRAVMAAWGTIPDDLLAGGPPGEEWKFSYGEGKWLIVVREK